MNEPKITRNRHVFSLERGVAVNIETNAEILWSILTDARARCPTLVPSSNATQTT
jgi:hypothetical protein